jgi:CO/xanthine dehydrogenase FAD-binding subunit
MHSFDYHRPKTLKEALDLLDHAVPLGGGTALTPMLDRVEAVVDLRDLGLDSFSVEEEQITLGSMFRLEGILEGNESIPDALRKACQQEAGWNLRNQASIGGMLMTAEGRSPLLTACLALEAAVFLEPGENKLPLADFLGDRHRYRNGWLITALQFRIPRSHSYQQVSRSPADVPIVCASLAVYQEGQQSSIRVALGGYGPHPLLISSEASILQQAGGRKGFLEAVRELYRKADDTWASAAYRSEIAGVLVDRLLNGGLS